MPQEVVLQRADWNGQIVTIVKRYKRIGKVSAKLDIRDAFGFVHEGIKESEVDILPETDDRATIKVLQD